MKWAGGGFLSTVGDLLQFGNAMLYSSQFEDKSGAKNGHRNGAKTVDENGTKIGDKSETKIEDKSGDKIKGNPKEVDWIIDAEMYKLVNYYSLSTCWLVYQANSWTQYGSQPMS